MYGGHTWFAHCVYFVLCSTIWRQPGCIFEFFSSHIVILTIGQIYRMAAQETIAIRRLTTKLRAVIRDLAVVDHRVVKIEERLGCKPGLFSAPGPVNVIFVGESFMPHVMIFNVSLPPVPEKSDVATRELQVLVDGVVTKTTEITDLSQATVDGLRASVNSIATLELRDVDAAGNMSDPSVHEFAVLDTIPPPAPGALGAIIVGEEITDDSVPPGP